MFPLFSTDQKDEMFYPPNKAGGEQKYDWYSMEIGEWFFIPCDTIKSKHYRPAIPQSLVDEGFEITVSKQESKKGDGMCFVVTRIE